MFVEAVTQAITNDLVGVGAPAQEQLTTTRTSVVPIPAPGSPDNLPMPPSGIPIAKIPWVVPALAVAAALLLPAGVTASVWRRNRDCPVARRT